MPLPGRQVRNERKRRMPSQTRVGFRSIERLLALHALLSLAETEKAAGVFIPLAGTKPSLHV
jgi:hypothetical protein